MFTFRTYNCVLLLLSNGSRPDLISVMNTNVLLWWFVVQQFVHHINFHFANNNHDNRQIDHDMTIKYFLKK